MRRESHAARVQGFDGIREAEPPIRDRIEIATRTITVSVRRNFVRVPHEEARLIVKSRGDL